MSMNLLTVPEDDEAESGSTDLTIPLPELLQCQQLVLGQ